MKSHQWLTQAATADRLHVRPETIAIWNGNPAFLEWYAGQVHQTLQPMRELAKLAIMTRTIQGSVKHGELFLMMEGYGGGLEPQPAGAPSNTNNGVQVGTVVFSGVPIPPNPQQAEAMRPPAGSNIIIPAPALPPMPVRPGQK